MRNFHGNIGAFCVLSICFCLFFILKFTSVAVAESCKPVLNNAIIFTAFECLNDSTALIVDSTKKTDTGWQYSQDSAKDGVSFGQVGGGDFEIYGLAIKEVEEHLYFVITSNLAIQGFDSSRATDGNIGWGDLFININNKSFLEEHKNSSFYAVRFAANNDSAASTIGVYGKVSAKSVTKENAGFASWSSYANHVIKKGATPILGDYGANQTYYDNKISYNVIHKSEYLGAIQFLDLNQLIDLGYDFNKSKGKSILGFTFEKKLIIDRCGVVGGDGTSCLDCNGAACGGAKRDICGVCEGDGISCLDCNGVPFGQAQVDQCGVCGGDGTSCLDCAGVPFGNKAVDQCGVCGGDGTSCLDCSGAINGSLTFDQCGVCGGDGTSCLDCTGIPFGLNKIDQCGICGGNGSSCLDCSGVPFGKASIDQCGICNGDGTSCLDCKGKLNGIAKLDQCGICDGDGTSCLGCEEIDSTESLLILDGAGANLKHVAFSLANDIQKSKIARKQKIKFIKRIKSTSLEMSTKVWTLAWTIQSKVMQCNNTLVCKIVNNEQPIENYKVGLYEFANYLRKEVREARRLLRTFKTKKAYKSINNVIVSAEQEIENIPLKSSKCATNGTVVF